MKAKIHINSVIAFAMMFILYEPWYMGEIQTFHQFNIIFRFVMVVLLMFEWIRIGKYDIPYIIFLILAVHVCYLIGSIQQESGITNAVKEFVNVSLKLLFVIYIFRENGKHLNEYIEGMSYYMVILWDYPKVCVNLQTGVRYNYSVWRFLLWQEKMKVHKKQQ